MPKSNELINVDLENFLDAKQMDAIPYDSSGKQVAIPDDAELFQFKFSSGGEEKGTATVSIDGTKTLNLYYDDAIMKEDDSASEWFDFVKQLKRFAMMHQLDFKTKNIDRLATDMKKREHLKKLDEGYYGTRHTSYTDKNPGTVRMIIKHSKPIEESDARFRNIEKIFLETETGERFLLDTRKPSVGRAYARHLAEGGRYNDERWNHISQIAEDINRLGGFVRATRNKQFNEGAIKLVNEAQNHYKNLRETMKRLQGSRGYNMYFESWKPTLLETEDESSITEMFLTQKLDPRVESALPVLSRLAKNVTEMVEINEFENWANDIVSEVLHPTQEGSLDDLVDLIGPDSEYMTLGPDGKNAINEIEGILDEPALNSRLQKAGQSKPDQDARPIILGWMQENATEKHYEQILNKLESETEPTVSKPKTQPTATKKPESVPPPPPEVAEDYDPRLSQKTQIAGTLPTYRYAKGLLDKVEGPQGKTLDFGAGLGLGSAEIGADSYEMHPKAGFKPNFDRVDSIPDESYAKIVSLNVLNVIPNDKGWRDAAVKDIGRILMQGGSALITTRGKDVLSAKGTPQDEPNSIVTTAGTFQKGFTPQELKGYVQSVLGGGFTVKTVKVGSAPAAILVTKGGEQVNELKGKMPTPDEMRALLQKQKKRFDDQGFVRAADDTAKMLKQRTQQPSAKVEEYLKEFEGEIEEACWKGYHKDGMKTMFGKKYPNCVKNKANENAMLDEGIPKNATEKKLFELLQAWSMFISFKSAALKNHGIDQAATNELLDMFRTYQGPVINGMKWTEMTKSDLWQNPKVIPHLLKYIYQAIPYVEERIKKFVRPNEQGQYLDYINTHLKPAYKEVVGLYSNPPVKEASKDKESSVKVRNPVAKNAMAGIGGGGMGKHKDKKQADKRGEVKHKKDKVPMDLEEGSLDRIRKLSGL